jgi:hypothetical protein
MSVLIDEDNVLKIKKAKEIITLWAEPPGLQELADEIGLNLKKLKNGFKQIYGDTVYGFYLIIKWISPENYLTVDLIM